MEIIKLRKQSGVYIKYQLIIRRENTK